MDDNKIDLDIIKVAYYTRMSDLTSISIVTIVRNDIEGFARTYNSLSNQDYSLDEWIIVDGSDSEEIQTFLQSNSNLEYKYDYRPADGIYDAMNQGLKLCNEKFVWYVNAGDCLSKPNTLRIVKSLIARNATTELFGFTVVYKTDYGLAYSKSEPKVFGDNDYTVAAIHHQGAIFSRALAKSVGGFDDSLALAADGKLLDALASNGNYKIYDLAIVDFRIGGASTQRYNDVIREIGTYRPRELSISTPPKMFRNKIRLLLNKNFSFLPARKAMSIYLHLRSRKIEKTINYSIEFDIN